jgi:hypothetical protein
MAIAPIPNQSSTTTSWFPVGPFSAGSFNTTAYFSNVSACVTTILDGFKGSVQAFPWNSVNITKTIPIVYGLNHFESCSNNGNMTQLQPGTYTIPTHFNHPNVQNLISALTNQITIQINQLTPSQQSALRASSSSSTSVSDCIAQFVEANLSVNAVNAIISEISKNENTNFKFDNYATIVGDICNIDQSKLNQNVFLDLFAINVIALLQQAALSDKTMSALLNAAVQTQTINVTNASNQISQQTLAPKPTGTTAMFILLLLIVLGLAYFIVRFFEKEQAKKVVLIENSTKRYPKVMI